MDEAGGQFAGVRTYIIDVAVVDFLVRGEKTTPTPKLKEQWREALPRRSAALQPTVP